MHKLRHHCMVQAEAKTQETEAALKPPPRQDSLRVPTCNRSDLAVGDSADFVTVAPEVQTIKSKQTEGAH